MPPPPGDLEHAQQVAGARGAGNWKTSRMVAHYSAGATADRGAVARYL